MHSIPLPRDEAHKYNPAVRTVMIEEPPPLVFAAPAERPRPEIVERFRTVPTSFIVDAMGGTGALDWRIKALVGNSLVGVALTCDCGPLDNLAFIAALADCRPGDVFVVATAGHVGAAVTGDLLIGVAKNRGAAGFVTDGLVRDLDDLESIGLPVFAMGVTPNSPQRRGPGSVGLPVVCGGVLVASGDVVVGDRDGVVVIPHARLSATVANLEHVKAMEAATLERVRGGLKELPVEVPALKRIGKA
jgi:4-hydroxy-4-methyl-2-oxoglutarate aldolase